MTMRSRQSALWAIAAAGAFVATMAAAQTEPSTPAPADSAQAAQPEAPVSVPHPRSYALVAAVGDELGVVSEGARTGTHMSPVQRTSVDVPHNLLNRLVLNMMDTAVVKLDPDSRRTYMTLTPGQLNGVEPMKREAAAIEKIVAALRPMPQRPDWDRIIIVTPTYTSMDLEGLPGKLQGPGVFVQNACQGRMGKSSELDTCSTDAPPPAGPEATTPDDKVVRVNYFVAPFMYMQLWVLNARTLEVIDRQKVFDSKKLYDPKLGPRQKVSDEFLVAQFNGVIESSVRRAAGDTVLRGQVETGPVREAPPGDAIP